MSDATNRISEATPRPWYRDGSTLYATDAGLNVFSALFQGQWPEGNAELARRSVNRDHLFDELVAMIEKFQRSRSVGDFDAASDEADVLLAKVEAAK